MPIALIDLWHYKTIVSGVTELYDFSKWLMDEMGIDVESVRSSLTEDELEGVDLLLIISPGYKFEEDEVKVVKNFVQRGGSLLVSRPSSKPDVINVLIEEFGAKFTGEEAESWAFYADIPKELESRREFKELKSILSKHRINRGLKAIAEGSPKQKYRPYILEILDDDWIIIGAARRRGVPYPTAIVKEFGNGKIAIIGLLYIFYQWKFWYENRELEEESYISNYNFMKRLIKYLIERSDK